eukprot:6308087-Pyramimonas_sp.AAC.1
MSVTRSWTALATDSRLNSSASKQSLQRPDRLSRTSASKAALCMRSASRAPTEYSVTPTAAATLL